MRIVKQNQFKNLGELHKEWTELLKDAAFISQQDLAPAHTAKSTKS